MDAYGSRHCVHFIGRTNKSVSIMTSSQSAFFRRAQIRLFTFLFASETSITTVSSKWTFNSFSNTVHHAVDYRVWNCTAVRAIWGRNYFIRRSNFIYQLWCVSRAFLSQINRIFGLCKHWVGLSDYLNWDFPWLADDSTCANSAQFEGKGARICALQHCDSGLSLRCTYTDTVQFFTNHPRELFALET